MFNICTLYLFFYSKLLYGSYFTKHVEIYCVLCKEFSLFIIIYFLQAKHAGEGCGTWGVDGDKGVLADMKELGVWDPLAVKIQTYKTAIEVCVFLLAINCVAVWQLLIILPHAHTCRRPSYYCVLMTLYLVVRREAQLPKTSPLLQSKQTNRLLDIVYYYYKLISNVMLLYSHSQILLYMYLLVISESSVKYQI